MHDHPAYYQDRFSLTIAIKNSCSSSSTVQRAPFIALPMGIFHRKPTRPVRRTEHVWALVPPPGRVPRDVSYGLGVNQPGRNELEDTAWLQNTVLED